MQYSCAYFPTGTEDLDQAQERKLEHIFRKLRLKPGDTLLDIGCGWGSLIRRAAEVYGVKTLGVTLSKNQAEYAREAIRRSGIEDRANVELMDYRELKSASFDKVVSVGMFEHVGREHLSEYFGQVARLLKPGGLFLNHGISRRLPDPQLTKNGGTRDIDRDAPQPPTIADRFFGVGSFSQSYVFPDGELVTISDANEFAEEAGFEVRDVENLREHYALTIRNWIARLDDHRMEAIQESDQITYRTWKLYLSSSVHGFETGQISVNQSLFSKSTGGKCSLPYSRADIYAA